MASGTTNAFADCKAIVGQITASGADPSPDLFDDDQYPLPHPEELVRGGWPKRKDRLGRAIMAASLYNGGHDFADDAKATAANVQHREYHHLYPRALIQDSFADHEVNSALNCVLLSWKTNRKIAAKSPADYIVERSRYAAVTEEQIRDRLESHLVPYDTLEDESGPIKARYEGYLKARVARMASHIQKLAELKVP